MGASTAAMSHRLPHSIPNPTKTPNSYAPQSQNPNQTPIKPFISFPTIPPATIQRRHLLLFSLPLSFTFQFSSRSSALPNYDPVSPAERDASITLSQRVSEAVELLEKGRELQAQGDFSKALEYFSQVVKDYKDFAFSDYAKVGRAIALYEVGDKDEAIAEMEDVSISLKGYPVKNTDKKLS